MEIRARQNCACSPLLHQKALRHDFKYEVIMGGEVLQRCLLLTVDEPIRVGPRTALAYPWGVEKKVGQRYVFCFMGNVGFEAENGRTPHITCNDRLHRTYPEKNFGRKTELIDSASCHPTQIFLFCLVNDTYRGLECISAEII